MKDEDKSKAQLMKELTTARRRLTQLEALVVRQEQAEAQQEKLIGELNAFAHTVAHDLKTPLSIIIGFASVLEEECASVPAEQLQSALHTITQTGRKMSKIVDELLLLAEIRDREVPLSPLDMAAIVAAAQERLAYVIEEYQAEITLPATWPLALGYAPWIEEVWANYLSNGLKYGGQPPRLELGATIQTDGMTRFWVRDNGQGLTPEQRVRLFTPFTQLSQIRVNGHGLGLSIVYRIINRKLGGQVGVESGGMPGQGSLFYFTLPSANGAKAGLRRKVFFNQQETCVVQTL
jgi:two-component system sensor histidine kinase/response regulator